MRLTVAMPFFDEAELLPSLPGLLDRIRAALDGHEARLLAIDDGSTDGTAEGLDRLAGGAEGALDVVRHETNRGVGAAIATALARASGEALIVFDPDEAYAPSTLAALAAAIETGGADVATLSPYHPEGGVEGVGPLRRLLSRAASWLYRRRLGSELHTFTCAVRAYRLPDARELLPAPADFTASAYLLAAALRRGLRVAEIPAMLRVRRAGRSKMRLLRTIRAHARLLRDLSVTAKGSKSGP